MHFRFLLRSHPSDVLLDYILIFVIILGDALEKRRNFAMLKLLEICYQIIRK